MIYIQTLEARVDRLQGLLSDVETDITNLKNRIEAADTAEERELLRAKLDRLRLRRRVLNRQITGLQAAIDAARESDPFAEYTRPVERPDWWDESILGPFPADLFPQVDPTVLSSYQQKSAELQALQIRLQAVEAAIEAADTKLLKDKYTSLRDQIEAELEVAKADVAFYESQLRSTTQSQAEFMQGLYLTYYPQVQGAAEEQRDIRERLRAILADMGLPGSLMSFIEEAIQQKKTFEQIVLELRQTPEYRAAYPENFIRQELGFSWLPEAQIRALRDQFRTMTRSILGVELSSEEIAQLIGRDKSPVEWERSLLAWKQFEAYGPVARRVFEEILGIQIDDRRLFEFFSQDIPTPELDRAYQLALMRAQPASLGLGVRPQEEAELLRAWGLTPEAVFGRYASAAAEMPRFERLAAIERAIEARARAGQLPSIQELLAGANTGLLIRGIVFQDPEALQRLSAMMSREVARFTAGGNPVRAGAALVGMASPYERA